MATPWAPDRRDIILIDWSYAIGKEPAEFRPMLVLSPKAFNERTGLAIGLPMSTDEDSETNPFAIKFQGPKNIACYVLGHQPNSLEWRARHAKAHPWKRVTDEVFAAACEQLNQIIAICD